MKSSLKTSALASLFVLIPLAPVAAGDASVAFDALRPAELAGAGHRVENVSRVRFRIIEQIGDASPQMQELDFVVDGTKLQQRPFIKWENKTHRRGCGVADGVYHEGGLLSVRTNGMSARYRFQASRLLDTRKVRANGCEIDFETVWTADGESSVILSRTWSLVEESFSPGGDRTETFDAFSGPARRFAIYVRAE